jgi:hypothetical protein
VRVHIAAILAADDTRDRAHTSTMPKIARDNRLPIMLIAFLVVGSAAVTTCDRARCSPIPSPGSDTTLRSPTPTVQHSIDKRDDGGRVSVTNNRSRPFDHGREVAAMQKLLLRTSSAVSEFLPFITSAHPGSRCFKHTVMYLTQLDDFKLWATKSERTYGHVRIVVLYYVYIMRISERKLPLLSWFC